ncbi:prepilin-type N-terminal cleavage/methylation domain-containing protein [Chitinibacter tainanensis]|uniref:type IV pilus modification PilV family protein n=1 Tax=Chitinibacter tainanensis TaxID=230667 RepID=UPI002352F42B|nr:prepilin-type N-terminal cleavage/methylation domain-containing protein [Chitinibacter tainanensis]
MPSKQYSRGFSLLEVLISLVVIAGGLLALAKFQGQITSNESYNKQRVQATHLAQIALDKLRIRANEITLANPSITAAALSTQLSTFATSLTTSMNGDSSNLNSVQSVITPNTSYTVTISFPTGYATSITNVAIPVNAVVSWQDHTNSTCSNNANNCSVQFRTIVSKASQGLY